MRKLRGSISPTESFGLIPARQRAIIRICTGDTFSFAVANWFLAPSRACLSSASLPCSSRTLSFVSSHSLLAASRSSSDRFSFPYRFSHLNTVTVLSSASSPRTRFRVSSCSVWDLSSCWPPKCSEFLAASSSALSLETSSPDSLILPSNPYHLMVSEGERAEITASRVFSVRDSCSVFSAASCASRRASSTDLSFC